MKLDRWRRLWLPPIIDCSRPTQFLISHTHRSNPGLRWRSGRATSLTVWTGTQRPFGVRSELAEAFRIPEERVRVLMPDTGSALRRQAHGRSCD